MIINSQLISDMLLKQETGEENKKFAIKSEERVSAASSASAAAGVEEEALLRSDTNFSNSSSSSSNGSCTKVLEEDCNNNLNNMSNRNIQNNSKMSTNYKFQQIKQETEDSTIQYRQPKSQPQNQHSNQQALTRCTGCQLTIEDKYVFNLMNTYWHEECLQCSQCRALLHKTCFFKNGLLFCKDDYLKQFGTRCNGCFELISTNELVMRFLVNNTVTSPDQQLLSYHLNCFKCIVCERLLQKGDEFVLKNEGIYCKHDYEYSTLAVAAGVPASSHSTLINRLNSKPLIYSASSSATSLYHPNPNSLNTTLATEDDTTTLQSPNDHLQHLQRQQQQLPRVKSSTQRKSATSRRITKRPRTILNAVQRYDFREAFKQSPKPCRKVREHLASKTGLSVRVVQVWFQNERAKVKKMQRRQQQHLINQKINGKKGNLQTSKAHAKSKNIKNKSKSKRKTIDSDSMMNSDFLHSEENSLAANDEDDVDEYDEFDDDVDDESEQSGSENEDLFSEDEDMDEDEEEEDDEAIKMVATMNSGTSQSPNLNLTTNTSSSSSSSSSLSSDFSSSNNSFNSNLMVQKQHAYHLNHHHHHQQQQHQNQQQVYHIAQSQSQLHFNQPNQTLHQQHQQNINNPIDRLYSMQNAYFCSS